MAKTKWLDRTSQNIYALSMQPSKRLFIGTFFETQQTAHLQKMQDALAPFAISCRRTDCKKMHFTWLFLGDTCMDSVSKIVGSLHRIAARPQFETSFCGLDLFGSGTAVALMKASKQMANIQSEIAGLHPECTTKKRFKPHATLMRDARFELPFEEVKKSVMVFNRPFTVNKFALVESNPQNGYAYSIIEEFEFLKD